MKSKALERAKDRLQRLTDAISALETPECTRKQVQDAWWSFLLAANGIYSQLEQGAKGHGQSEAWFGRKKHERKSDELLSYVHHARNADEHGIEGTTAEHGIYVTAGNRWTQVTNSGITGQAQVSVESGKPLAVQLHAPGIHLLPVCDRGVIYRPPQRHFGQPLPDIHGALKATREHLTNLLKEAAQLPTH